MPNKKKRSSVAFKQSECLVAPPTRPTISPTGKLEAAHCCDEGEEGGRRSAAVNPLFELLVADNVSSKDVSSFFAAVPGDINVDAVDSMGYSCLGLSIEKGLSLDVIKVLVQEGFADVNLVQHGTQSILQMACSSIRAELVEYLLSRKQTYPNLCDSYGNVALHTAIAKSGPSIVSLLLQCKKVDVNARNQAGQTPVHIATELNKPHVLSEFARCEREVDWLTGSPLHLAIRKGYEECVKVLVSDAKVDVEAPDEAGLTPLAQAMMSATLTNKEDSVIRRLVEAGADVSISIPNLPHEPASLLDFACSGRCTPEAAAELLDVSTVPLTGLNAIDAEGTSVLHRAVVMKDTNHPGSTLKVVRSLLDAGADLHLESRSQGSPYERAARAGNLDVVKYLQTLGAHEYVSVNESALSWLADLPADTKEAAKTATEIANSMLSLGSSPCYDDLKACVEAHNHVLLDLYLNHLALDTDLMAGRVSLGPSMHVAEASLGLLLTAIACSDNIAVQALLSRGLSASINTTIVVNEGVLLKGVSVEERCTAQQLSGMQATKPVFVAIERASEHLAHLALLRGDGQDDFDSIRVSEELSEAEREEMLKSSPTGEEAVAVVTSLLEAGADTNAELGEIDGEKIYGRHLLTATYALPFSTDLVRILLKRGEVKVNEEDRIEILRAAANKATPPDIMEDLIACLLPLSRVEVMHALRHAVMMLRVGNVRLLLEKAGCAPRSLVTMAIRWNKGDSTILGYLIARSSGDSSPHKQACATEIARILLDAGADPDPSMGVFTQDNADVSVIKVLHSQSKSGATLNEDLVMTLLRTGLIDVNCPSGGDLSVRGDDRDISPFLAYLFTQTGNNDEEIHDDSPPLVPVATEGQARIDRVLVAMIKDCGANVTDPISISGEDALYPLDIAVMHGRSTPVIRAILEDALPALPRPLPQETYGRLLGIACSHNRADVVLTLINAGLDPNATCKFEQRGFTPLQIALSQDCAECACTLVQCGADVTVEVAPGTPSYLELALRDFAAAGMQEEQEKEKRSTSKRAKRPTSAAALTPARTRRSKAKAGFARALLFSPSLGSEEDRSETTPPKLPKSCYAPSLAALIALPSVGDMADFEVLLKEVIRRCKNEAGVNIDADMVGHEGVTPLFAAMRKHRDQPGLKSELAVNILKDAGASASKAEQRLAQEAKEKRSEASKQHGEHERNPRVIKEQVMAHLKVLEMQQQYQLEQKQQAKCSKSNLSPKPRRK